MAGPGPLSVASRSPPYHRPEWHALCAWAGMYRAEPLQPDTATDAPFTWWAELTYRCPLHCAYCSNPVDYVRYRELGTDEWRQAFDLARRSGVTHLGLSGGEPLLREDLEDLVVHAKALGMQVRLLTSGIGLDEARAARLRRAGLDAVTLSWQDSTRELNDFLTSTRTFELKARAAAAIVRQGWTLDLDCVMHRFNLPHVGRLIAMAEALGADSLDLSMLHDRGWAALNRDALAPTADELDDARAIVDAHRLGLEGRMSIRWREAQVPAHAPQAEAGLPVTWLEQVPASARQGAMALRCDATSVCLTRRPASDPAADPALHEPSLPLRLAT